MGTDVRIIAIPVVFTTTGNRLILTLMLDRATVFGAAIVIRALSIIPAAAGHICVLASILDTLVLSTEVKVITVIDGLALAIRYGLVLALAQMANT